MALSFSGIRDDGSNIVQSLENIESASVRVTTEPKINISTIHADGALPPKVGTETKYQITMSVENTHNEITGAKFVAKIPFYVNWVGKVTKNEKVAYNPDTREVIWTLGNVVAGAGNTTALRSAEIQLSITPSLSQLGSSPTLINEATLTGYDDFAKVDVKVNKGSLNTVLNNDPMFPSGGGSVVE